MNQLKIYLPPPSNWQDFQVLMKYIAQSRYMPDSVIEYGSVGQRQNGVDIYAVSRDDKKVGIQCKETKKELTKKVLTEESDKALKYSEILDTYIIATTETTDVDLQDEVNRLNTAKSYHFHIKIEFWGDIVNEINRFSMVLNSCYSAYVNQFKSDDEHGHLEILRMAFNRPAYQDNFLHERNYDHFCEALAATKQLFRTGLLVDRISNLSILQTTPVDMLPPSAYRKKIESIEKQVANLYSKCISERIRLTTDATYAQERAGEYNIKRRKLLTELNKLLEERSLAPVIAHY